MEPRLRDLPKVSENVYLTLESNRKATNPTWSMAQYIEHIAAMHERVLVNRKAKKVINDIRSF